MSTIKVLLIEDDKVDQMAFKRFVQKENIPYHYEIAGSILETKKLLDSGEFDVIVSDYFLGDGTALDILGSIAIPVVITTGMGDEEIAANAIKAGAYDYLIKDPEQNYLKILPATVENAIRRKRAEDALKETEEEYRNLFENVPTGVYRTTPDGRILMANPALTKMLGFSSLEEMISRNLEQEGFEDENARSRFKELLEREGKVVGLESAWLKNDGSVIFVRESARAVRGKNNAVLYYEGTVEDITERKRAEEALKQKLDQLAKKSRYETIISTVTRSVHQSINLQDVLENAVDSMGENIDKADIVGIYLVEGKEAVLKGIGCGTRDLDRCVVDLDPRRQSRVVGPPETVSNWSVASWTPQGDYAAAVAVASGTLELTVEVG